MRIIILKITLIFILFTTISHSEIINKIEIKGNKRVTEQTIFGIINFKINKNYSIEEVNILQKKLFESNFFKTINIELKNNIMIISVDENPIIDFYFIQGVKSKIREEFFYSSLSLGPNKIFSEYLLKKDIESIRKNYLDAGYLNVKIQPEISQISGNALNVIYRINEGKSFKVNRIYFIGDSFYSSSTLNDVITTSEHGWWKFLSSSSTYNEQRVGYDKSQLKDFYLNNGFYDAQITSVDTSFLENQLVDITYSINSGKRYSISNFKLNDPNKNLKSDDIEDINNMIKDKLKTNYSRKNIIKIKNLIDNYLKKKKIEFVGIGVSEKKVGQNKIELFFNFIKSDRLFVNLINVKGNSITEESVIRNNLLFSEGDSFSVYKLTESIKNLRNTGIFSNIKPKTINAGKEKVDVVIDVEEQPTGSISAGIGIGSSESSIGGELKEKNLFGKGIASNVNARFGTQKITGSINFAVPDFQNSGNTVGGSLYALTTDFSNAGYESKVIGGSVFTEYSLYEDIFFKYGLSIDLDRIDTNDSASTLYKSREGDYVTYKTFYNINNDRRNRRFKPSEGYRTGFGQSLAFPGSDITYLSNNLYGSYYNQVSKDYIINLKAGVETINSLSNEDIKLSDRKFLSNKKIRGFESYGIGPKDGDDHIGGNYSAYSSIGSTFPNPFPEKWNADSIIFLDVANVWGVDYDSSKDSDKIRSSIGIGLDWTSPLGPLSFTYAEPLSSASGDKKESFSFQIGSSF
ncbi:MAG: outer membrane protein assembly factor BamA [Candidatus Pelagibacter sp.]|nr:outer membrane protein assembly factor BamA [Candidatus Pelagibacter sp.]